MQIADTVFIVIIIIFSAIIHEVMHGYVADRLGDPTARYAGRLTLNPIPHLDPFGSIILPLVLALGGSPIFFGYAKPVPYNPYNLRPGRFSEALVAGAGPAANACLAIIAAILIRINILSMLDDALFLVVVVNVMLCIFNLIPVPPLDGSKVLEALLPLGLRQSFLRWRVSMDRNPLIGMAIVLLIVLVLGGLWSNLIHSIAGGLAGPASALL